MKSWVFDIEANGLKEIELSHGQKITAREATRIHLLVLRSPGSATTRVFREDQMAEGFKELMSADVIIGHNIIDYDLPILRRLAAGPDHEQDKEPKAFDTLVAARLLWPDAQNHPFGGNSLKSFGQKLGCAKGDFQGPWDEWSQEMEDYCIQDTAVSDKIRQYLVPLLGRIKLPFRIETRVAEIISLQQENGVRIDLEAADRLICSLEIEQALNLDHLRELFPARIETLKTPAFYFATYDQGIYKAETKGALKALLKGKPDIQKRITAGPMRTKEHPFNPGSSLQIAERLKEKRGWKAPTTEAGNPSITEETLTGLDFPEAESLLRYMMAEKRLQHLTDWVTRARLCRTPGVIHPSINSLGASTGRMTHSQPNQTACPKIQLDPATKKPALGYAGRYGWEMRSLWKPTREGWAQIGADASGLELRMLGNRMAPYDDGAYAKEVVEGDIHTLNMKAGGLQTRDQAKTTIYAFLYGAGDTKIGTTIADHPSLTPEQRELYSGKARSKVGSTFRQRFQKALPALGTLVSVVKSAAQSEGSIPLLDGRRAPIRSSHSALNTLLQGDGAMVMKLALILADKKLREKWRYGIDWAFMLNAHDECQAESRPDIADEVGRILVESIREAGTRLKVRCPLDGEYKVGNSWAETH